MIFKVYSLLSAAGFPVIGFKPTSPELSWGPKWGGLLPSGWVSVKKPKLPLLCALSDFMDSCHSLTASCCLRLSQVSQSDFI